MPHRRSSLIGWFLVAMCSTQVPPLIENGGGENIFLGRTRCEDNSEHGPLVLLRYEAKQSMALKELDKVFASHASRPPEAIFCTKNKSGREHKSSAFSLARIARHIHNRDFRLHFASAGARGGKRTRPGLRAHPTLAWRRSGRTGLGARPGLVYFGPSLAAVLGGAGVIFACRAESQQRRTVSPIHLTRA